MHYKNLLSVAAAVAFGSSQVAAEINHGDVEFINDQQIKWQQIGKGMWTSIPVDEWNETVHQRSDVDYVQMIESRAENAMQHGTRNSDLFSRDLELESRNFESFCQSVATCANGDGVVQLVGCMGIYIEAMGTVAGGASTLWEAIGGRTTVVSISAGIIATTVGIKTEKSLWPPEQGGECSTSDNGLDAFSGAVSAALKHNPTATSINIEVSGPEFSYSAAIAAAPKEGPTPTPVVGQCFSA